MMDNRTFSTIDVVLQKFQTPVGPLFVAAHHDRVKKCFSRDTAIRYLAFFMTSHVFERSGFEQRYPDAVEINPTGGTRILRGAVTHEYYVAHQRCMRRLRLILAKKREMQKWCEKWDAFHDRVVKEQAELQACKPEGIK